MAKKDGQENNQAEVLSEEDDFEFGKNSGEDGEGSEGAGEGSEGEQGAEGSAEGKGDSGEGGDSGEAGEGSEGTGADAGDGSGDGSEGKGEEGAAEGEGAEGEGGEGGEAGDGVDKGEEGKGSGGEGAEGGEGDGSEGKGAGSDGGEEKDIFGDEFADDGKGAGEEGSGDPIVINELASELEVEAATKEEFIAKVNEKIESAKKEIKVDGYKPEAQSVIKHLNDNDGKLEDFFDNKVITQMQGVIGLEPDQKVLMIRTNELITSGVSQADAEEQAKTELEEYSSRQLKDKADEINEQARGLINDEVTKIVGDREAFKAQERQKDEVRVKGEIDSLKTFVSTQEEFMGIPLTPKAKQNIVREIEAGVFDEVANKSPEASKFAAYMIQKFGKTILENLDKKVSEQNRTGHNAAIDKSTGALHNTKAAAQGKRTGQQKQEGGGEKKNFDSWADEDMFEQAD